MSVLKGLFLLCCTAVAMGNTPHNCSLPVSPLMCPVVQGAPGRDGRDGIPGRDGPAGPPGAPGTAAFDIMTIRKQIRDEVLKDINNKMGQSKRKCHNLGRFSHLPATSCQEVYECNQDAPSGQYWINATNGRSMVIREVYCDMENVYGGNKGGWMRVAFFNMSDPTHSCPSPLRTGTTQGRRLCTRSVDSPFSSVVFHTHRVPYTAVCGRALAYQYGYPNGFYAAASGTRYHSINDPYVDGISITHGQSRKHIWTYAAGRAKTDREPKLQCPCSSLGATKPQTFVGEYYFCDEGASNTPTTSRYYLDAPLWDGKGCLRTSSCCATSGMPWFCRTLPRPTTDDIEVRWCSDQDLGNEATATELLEIFVM